MKFWQRRVPRLAAALVMALMCVQFGTYFAYGRRTMPQAALHPSLRTASFILIDAPTWNALTTPQQTGLTTVLGRYAGTVYHAMAEMPAAQTVREPNTDREWRTYQIVATQPWRKPDEIARLKQIAEAGDHFVRFVGGYQLQWHLAGRGLFWMRSEVQYSRGYDDAAGNDSTYVWLLCRWVRVWTHGGYVT